MTTDVACSGCGALFVHKGDCRGDQDRTATDGARQVTPEMCRLDPGKRARRQHVRFRLRLLWGRIGYRPTMRLIHRLNWCWMEPTPVDPNRAWCHWCGMRGRR